MSILLTSDSSSFKGVNPSNFYTPFSQPTTLPENAELALVSAKIWYSYYNIKSIYHNNTFRYYNGSSYVDIVIPDGNYQLFQLNSYIQGQMKANGDYDSVNDAFYVSLDPNYSTLRCKLTITADGVSAGYKVDFTSTGLGTDDQLREILGFDDGEYDESTEGQHQVDITRGVNSIQIHVDIVSGSIEDGRSSNIVWSFTPDLPPGSLISIQPASRIYLPCNYTTVSGFQVWLTDQQGRAIDLNDNPTAYTFHIRAGRDNSVRDLVKSLEKILP